MPSGMPIRPSPTASPRDYPRTLIRTDSMDVGLPEGTMGNSEVGHQNLGAGRIVDQESVRITRAVRDGKLADNTTLVAACNHAKTNDASLHLFGIVSDAGVHGLLEHLYGVLELAEAAGLSRRSSSTPSPTAATRRRRRASATSPKSPPSARRWASAASPASSAGTTRWTATTVGIACSWPTTCSPAGPRCRTSTMPPRPSATSTRTTTTSNRRGDEFVTPRTVGERGGVAGQKRRLRSSSTTIAAIAHAS